MKTNSLILALFLSAATGNFVQAQTKSSPTEKVYVAAEQMPQYPGGEAALKTYFQNALASHKATSNGTVTLSMVIDKTGQPKNIEIGSGMGPATDAAVLDAAKKMAKWQPGKQKGQSVNVRMTVPVNIAMTAQAEQPDVVDEKIYTFVEQQPEFPGGEKAMMDYLAKNIKYAADAQENNIEGLVVVQFVVSRKGEIQEPKILKRLLPSLDAEAVRVVKSMPTWKPGKQNGRPVNVNYTMPIRFSL